MRYLVKIGKLETAISHVQQHRNGADVPGKIGREILGYVCGWVYGDAAVDAAIAAHIDAASYRGHDYEGGHPVRRTLVIVRTRDVALER